MSLAHPSSTTSFYDDEFYNGYRDGIDAGNPEPSENRSHCYRHSFMVARADKRGEPVPNVHEKADEAERKDRSERDWSDYRFYAGGGAHMISADEIDAIVEARDFGRATSVRRGRHSEWPYVPIIEHRPIAGVAYKTRTEQIPWKAFATRGEAVAYAGKVIKARRDLLRLQLADPRHRALREQYGLPREIKPVSMEARP